MRGLGTWMILLIECRETFVFLCVICVPLRLCGEFVCSVANAEITQRLIQHFRNQAIDVDAGGVEKEHAVVFLGAEQ
jgi:hypothetical protein